MAGSTGQLAQGQFVTYSPPGSVPPCAPDLRILHYNDVYHIEPGSREPVGGLARFKTLFDQYRNLGSTRGGPECLTFFSGDAFNPSLESTVTKGKHMVPALNTLATTAACLGNHDLDFGVEQFEYLACLCKFPWLCANVLTSDGVPLGRCERSIMLTSSNGVKVGLMGLVEREWLDTINTLPPNLEFLEPATLAKALAAELRKRGAEIVIALTHQRQPNDQQLAADLEPGTVDLILSGHDHFYAHEVVNGTHILRSGTDFKQLSYLECWKQLDEASSSGSPWTFHILCHETISFVDQDPSALQMVSNLTASLLPKLSKPVGYTAAPLDARFMTVRMRESNLGNFVCDLMRLHYDADCCLMCSGTIRGDQVYPPGVLKVKDLMNCFPFEDPCVVIGITGKNLLEALENGVSKYPALEGRFLQVSGIKFTFDPEKAPGERCFDVLVQDEPLDLEKEYKVVTREYMVRGKDGFRSLMLQGQGGEARSIVSDESGMLISALLRQYFLSLKVVGKWKRFGHSMGKFWDGVKNDLHDLHPVKEPAKAVGQTVANGHPRGPGGGKAQPKPAAERFARHHHHHTRSTDSSSDAAHFVHSDSDYDSEHPHHARHPSERSEPRSEPNDHQSLLPTEFVGFALDITGGAQQHTPLDRNRYIARKYVRKWWNNNHRRRETHPLLCDTSSAKEIPQHVKWTRAICPRKEGRIRIVGVKDEEDEEGNGDEDEEEGKNGFGGQGNQ
jgi:5'-nucleotidase